MCIDNSNEKMKKEIGGYMELEHFQGREMYPDLLKFNLARTAFVWLLKNLKHERVFIPRYICNSVPDSAAGAGFNVVFYSLDQNLEPVFKDNEEPGPEDIMYVVNYYGQLTYAQMGSYCQKYKNLIIDNAQSFYTFPVPHAHTLYSPRKFFGLSDGAYLSTNIQEPIDDLPIDRSSDRFSYLLGRFEDNARDHYGDMLKASEEFDNITPKRMSLLTENTLKAIDYQDVRRKRLDNYTTLSRLLPNKNTFNRVLPDCPFAYPYYCKDGVRLRKYLAGKNIFVPTNWSYLRGMPELDDLAYDWSCNILPLPVDQRYSEKEMHMIADAVRSF